MIRAEDISTGDFGFCSSNGLIPLGIRLRTNFLGVLRGAFVPHHVFMFRRDDKDLWVYESQADDGFIRMPWDEWKRRRKGQKVYVVLAPFGGMRSEISSELASWEGTPYMKVWEFLRVARDRAPLTKRAVCSTILVRILHDVGERIPRLAMWMGKLDKANTDPDELFRWLMGKKCVKMRAM